MNEQIEDILKVAFEDNLRIQEIGQMIWDEAFEQGRKSKTWIPEVTEWQVFSQIQGLTSGDDDETMRVSRHLASWFNDASREAPVEPIERLESEAPTMNKLPRNKQQTLKHIQKARRANDAIGDRKVRQEVDEALTYAYNVLVRSDKTID